jgi:hypothetical protein
VEIKPMPLRPAFRTARALSGAALAFAAIAPADAQTDADALATKLYPKVSFDTVVSVDAAHMDSNTGPDRGPGFVFWADSTLLVDVNDTLSVSGLFQFKPRASLPEDNPNNVLFINRGLNRQEGGKMKELYARYGDWRFGKFVQNFGRGYAMLPGPWSSDFTEEPEAYEPSEMLGVEKVTVFEDESEGWRQLTLSAFMVDRTFLHQSWPYNEGMIHLKDGGVGNTRYPENLMATYDAINQPLGNWGHLSWQAGVIRWGKTQDAEKGEWWTTAGANLVVPIDSRIGSTLRGQYSQLHFYLEAVRRDNFEGVDGNTREFLSGSAEYMLGRLTASLTTTQRWTQERLLPGTQRDEILSFNLGYALPSTTLLSLGFAQEKIGEQRGFYAGLRVTQGFTLCSKCMTRATAY